VHRDGDGAVFRVDFSPPIGQPVTVSKCASAIATPRSPSPATAPPPARHQNRLNTSTIVNGLNYALEWRCGGNGFNEGRLFTVDFKTCMGAVPATLSDCSCAMLDCASSFGTVQGCTCTVTTP
jgi:hypothetical protein